jgi:hypothetical protein
MIDMTEVKEKDELWPNKTYKPMCQCPRCEMRGDSGILKGEDRQYYEMYCACGRKYPVHRNDIVFKVFSEERKWSGDLDFVGIMRGVDDKYIKVNIQPGLRWEQIERGLMFTYWLQKYFGYCLPCTCGKIIDIPAVDSEKWKKYEKGKFEDGLIWNDDKWWFYIECPKCEYEWSWKSIEKTMDKEMEDW